MKRFGRIVLSLTTIFIIFSFAAAVYAEPSDIKGHWANEEISRWIDRGILFGSNGKITPDGLISRAEFVAIVNRIIHYQERSDAVFSDIKGSEWYVKDISMAVEAGILVGNGGKIRPKDPVSRQEAAVILTQVFGLTARDSHAADAFDDAAAIPSWSRNAVCAMVENGFTVAKSGNVFAPEDKMTRAEAVKMMDGIVRDLKNKPGTYTGTVDGNLVVNTAGVVLKSMTVNGSLYLTEGIGDGDVTLDNVTVKGMTVVAGGGEHSITISNSSLNGKLIIAKKDGKIRIVAEGKTEIPDVLMQSGGILEERDITGNGFGRILVAGAVFPGQEIELDGDFDTVSVEAPETGVRLTGGTVKSLELKENATGSVINIADGAVLDTLTVNAAASIKGGGKVNTANINANGVTMEQKPGAVNKKDGVTLPSNLEAIAGNPAGGALPGGGGIPGGGGGPQADLRVLSAYAKVGSSQVAAGGQGGEWTVSLAGLAPQSMFTNLYVSTSKDVTEAEVSYLGFTRKINFSDGSAAINVKSLLGDLDQGAEGVSVQSIRDHGGASFTVVLKGGGSTASISINLEV
jgi:hypothetical protein